MNFDSILIITYGRSGSTLLQGVLNSHEEVLVRGENHNFCQGLYQSYKALTRTRKYKLGAVPTNPFFGSVFLDEEYYLSSSRQMVKNLLLADQIGNEKIRCYGFKEIRYEKITSIFEDYLNFLKLIFPNPAFIINTRNKEDVINSRKKNNWKGNISFDSLERAEETFFNFIDNNPDCAFHITYQDVIGKTDRLSLLHSFLGLPYSEEKINNVLSFQHSNTRDLSANYKLQNSAEAAIEIEENFRIVSIEERHLAQLKKDLLLQKEENSKLDSFSFQKLLQSLIPFLKRG